VLIASVEQNTPGRSPEQIKAFFNEVRQRAGNLPGILSAGYSSFTPISGSQLGVNVVVEDRPFKAGENGHTLFAGVSPDYFRTLGIPLLQGRDFTAQEIQSFPPSVAIINRTMALRYFGNVSPVGRHLRIVEGSFPPLEIIGIAADSKYNDLREATQNFFYLPSSQGKTLMFRTSSDPDVFIQPIRELIASIDTAVTIVSIKRLRDQVGESYRMDKVVTVLCSGFGVLALLLSCLGLYGILSFSVERRRKEIALRMALGATRESVLRLVVLKGMGLTLLGFAIGLPAAIAAVSILKGFLFGIGRFDIWTVVPVSILLLVSSFLACYRPARHAASLDPNDVLRME
jgi:predicted permease